MMADLAGSAPALAVDDRVATLTLHNPARRNAIGLGAWRALPNLVADAERNTAVRVILVRGDGGHFGAGNDISELAGLSADDALAFADAMAQATHAVDACAKPVIMAIEGACYGASVALALAGDIRVASSNAVFAVTPAKLGLLYLRSDLHRLVSTIGAGSTKRLIYTAAPIDAARAEAIGLVDEVLPSDRFESGVLRLADTIADGSPFTLRRTKEMLRDLYFGAPLPETAASLGHFVEATQGADFQEGHAAFRGRRAPRFR